MTYTVVQSVFTNYFSADEAVAVDSAAAYFNTDRPGLLRLGAAIVAYIEAYYGPPAQPVSPPPANTGPISVSVSYSAADAQSVLSLAQLYGLTGDQLIRYGVNILGYVWYVNTH